MHSRCRVNAGSLLLTSLNLGDSENMYAIIIMKLQNSRWDVAREREYEKYNLSCGNSVGGVA